MKRPFPGDGRHGGQVRRIMCGDCNVKMRYVSATTVELHRREDAHALVQICMGKQPAPRKERLKCSCVTCHRLFLTQKRLDHHQCLVKHTVNTIVTVFFKLVDMGYWDDPPFHIAKGILVALRKKIFNKPFKNLHKVYLLRLERSLVEKLSSIASNKTEKTNDQV